MTQRLENIKSRIERMGKTQHIEVLKLMRKNPDIKLNENKSGVYINLSWLPESTLLALEEYIAYIDDQESSFLTLETQKEEFKNTFFGRTMDATC